MAIMLDADVIIRGEKGSFDLKSSLASQQAEQCEVTAITVAELWHGIERATVQLAVLPVVPYTEQTGYEHARIWSQLETAGKMTGYYDLIVAATALERGSRVATSI